MQHSIKNNSFFQNIFNGKKSQIWLLLSLTGLLHAVSLTPINLWPVGFLILFPVFYIIDNYTLTKRQKLLSGFILSLSFSIFTSSWLIGTIVIFGEVPVFFSLLIFLGYALITASRYWIFLFLIYAWKLRIESRSDFQPQNPGRINHLLNQAVRNRFLIWGGIWTLAEIFGWQLFPVFGANMVGGDDLLMQTADIAGIHGTSLIWFLTNLAVYEIFKQLKSKSYSFTNFKQVIQNDRGLISVIILFILAHVYGLLARNYWADQENNYTTKQIGIIQNNTPLSIDVWRNQATLLEEVTREVVEGSASLARKAKEEGRPLDAIVWSESGVPFQSYMTSSLLRGLVVQFMSEYHVPLIINDLDSEYNISSRGNYTWKHYNNLRVLDDTGAPVDKYHKILLLPFGEFMPFGNLIPALKDIVPAVSDFSRGDEIKTLKMPSESYSLEFIPSICYELLPPFFTWNFYRESGKKARLIINQTNDTWFGVSAENFQHIGASRIRAIELRIPIVRATNSGISAYVDTTGKIRGTTARGVKDSKIYQVKIPPFERPETIFSRTGPWLMYIYILLTGFILASAYIVSRKKEKA